jgi:hypothetical protein
VVIAAALSMAQPVEPPTILVRSTPPTVEETLVFMTRRSANLDCTLIDASMRRYALTIEQRGGRGYVDPRVDDPNRRFRTTALSFRVLTDETGFFQGNQLHGSDVGQLRFEGNHSQNGPVRVNTFTASHNQLAMIVYANVPTVTGNATVRFTGFCNVTTQAQTPLTEAEVAEVLAQ